MTEMLRTEPTNPVESFTFVVDPKVKETPLKSTPPFDHLSLRGGRRRRPDDAPAEEIDEASVVVRSSVDTSSPSIVNVGGHSFVQSAILAYNQHLHLVLRPDDVWLALVTQFSFYVSKNAEALRDKFVSFEGKEELVVSLPGRLYTAPYEELAMMMTTKIAENIKDPSVREWILPDFSTTSNTDRVVGAFALMATLKEYFDYTFQFVCGLPKVTILGSVEDWRKVKERAERFVEFDTDQKYMKTWTEMLLPVLEQFILSAEGKPDTEWWNRIAHQESGGSGPDWVSGWITVFMVFSTEGKWMGGAIEGKEWFSVDTDDIPKGYAYCPLKIEDSEADYDAEIYVGHIVAKLMERHTTIVPQLDWCILLKDK